MTRVAKLVCGLCLVAALCGCSTVRESTPPRTATEELLLSAAVNRALAGQRLAWLEGKKTFLDDKYFEGYDKGHALGAIRELLSANGALLVNSQPEAQVVVEARCRVLSMDNSSFLIGIPTLAIPLSLTTTVPTPEVALYKRKRADTLAEFALFAYDRASGRYLQSVRPMRGRAHLHRFTLLVVISWKKTDVPELKHMP